MLSCTDHGLPVSGGFSHEVVVEYATFVTSVNGHRLFLRGKLLADPRTIQLR